jgi:glycosyltransferase involved in cell wall biosynthesis
MSTSFEKKINVLHIVPLIESTEGGIVSSTLGLLNSLTNINNYLVSFSNLKGAKKYKYINKKKITAYIFNRSRNNKIKSFLTIFKFIKNFLIFKKIDLVHVNGLWNASNFIFSLYAIVFKIPLIISPCGMLEPWALRQKFLKKKIAYIFYQKIIMKRAKVIIAKSHLEYKTLKVLGFNKICIIPNGIDFQKINPRRLNKKKFNALFLSRVHKKKGIYDLLISWSKIRPKNWTLNIVGSGNRDYLNFLKKYCKASKLNNIKFHGHLVDSKKHEIYKKSDLFILPSYSENFGNVIAEALNYRIPVVTTKSTPWNNLSRFRCGWIIKSGEEYLTKCLQKIFYLSPEILFNMGCRSYKIIKKFDYAVTTKKMENLYNKSIK